MSLTEAIREHIVTGEGDFNQLALAVFDHQFHQCQPYQRYCLQLNKTPQQIRTWQEIPAVSTEVFREFALTTSPISTAKYIFETSGTSQEKKGRHYYHDMTLYDAAIQSSFMASLKLSKETKTIFRILTPSFNEISTSSLFYMFQKVVEWYGDESSHFYFKDNKMDCDQLINDLQEDIKLNRPVVLLGTAFSFVNFCDELIRRNLTLSLPEKSKLLETGGLKGRARVISRDELYHLFSAQLGLHPDHCFAEYGMTELSSQSYSPPSSPVFQSPHWMPVRIIHPETGEDVAEGESGLVQFFDLANYTAVSAIVTSDLAIKRTHGFELIGRAPLAVLRGCSTAFEEGIKSDS
jgi:hypothetical protein